MAYVYIVNSKFPNVDQGHHGAVFILKVTQEIHEY